MTSTTRNRTAEIERQKNAAHTPGPWRYEAAEPAGVNLKRAHWRVGQADAPARGVALAFGDDEANARLIAAAPDMLEALKDIIEQAERSIRPLPPDLADSIRVFGKQAVAKAEGRS